jgi:hypothetical protein
MQRPNASPACREYVLTALAKLVARFPGSAARLKEMVAAYRQSSQLEVQTRSVEYGRLFNLGSNIGPQVRVHSGTGKGCGLGMQLYSPKGPLPAKPDHIQH